MRRPSDAEIASAGTDLSRQPLWLADAALDRRALSRPHRPRGALPDRRNGRLTVDLCSLIERNAAFAPEKPAIHFEGQTLSYAAVNGRIEQTARALKSEFGVRRGDRVAILSLNRPDYLVLLYACARLGAMLVPLNWRLAIAEQMYILTDAGAKVLMLEQAFAAILPELKKSLPDAHAIGLDFVPTKGG